MNNTTNINYRKWLMEDLQKISPLFSSDHDLGRGYRRYVCPATPPVALSLADYRQEMINLADYYLTYPEDENVDFVLSYLEGGFWYRVPLVEDAEAYQGIEGVEVPESSLWADWRFFMAPVWWCSSCRRISLSANRIAPYSEGKMDADLRREHGTPVNEIAGGNCHDCRGMIITYQNSRQVGFSNLKGRVNPTDSHREIEQKNSWAHHLNQLPVCYHKRKGNKDVNRKNLRIKKGQVINNFWEVVWLRILELVEDSDYHDICSQSPISDRIRYYTQQLVTSPDRQRLIFLSEPQI